LQSIDSPRPDCLERCTRRPLRDQRWTFFRDTFLGDSEKQIPLSISGGPYVGYKYTAPFGFTVELQAGIAGAVGSGEPDLASGFGIAKSAKLLSVSTSGHTASAYGALFNANIGWSF
jgi:hypothetical protein